MKRFSILCCLMLLLNVLCPVGYVHAESAASPTDQCIHEWHYDESGHYCSKCGNESEKTEHILETKCVDSSGHYEICTVCGYTSEVSAHWQSCANPGVCKECGYEGDIKKTKHKKKKVWVAEGEAGCYSACSGCGRKEGETLEHEAACTDTTRCAYCGYEGDIEHIIHENSSWTTVDENSCRFTCSDCGLTSQQTHWATCEDRNHCEYCGYEGDIEHVNHTESQWVYDETSHYLECPICGKFYEGNHFGSCIDSTHCAYCGMEGEFNDGEHMWFYVEHDEESHWFFCDLCKKDIKEAHKWSEPVIVEATKTTDGSKTYTCECGETKVEIIPATGTQCQHEKMVWKTYNANGCYPVCASCGEQLDIIYAHSALCTDATHCVNCGYEGVIKYLIHSDSAFTYDAEYHYIECPTCGLSDKDEHYAICTDPTHCAYCGLEGDFGEVEHISAVDGIEFDANWHWFTCIECGEDIKQEHFYDDPVIVKATETTDGSKTYSCLCGATKVEIIPATGIVPCEHEITWVSDGAEGCHAECALCDYVGNCAGHEASCTDTTHCSYCGHEGDISYIAHEGSYSPINEKCCGLQCSACGEEVRHGHYAYCDDPTVCVFCGYEGEIKLLYHQEDEYSTIDEKTCGYVCSTCGEQVIQYHWAYCDDPTHCIYCGYEGSITNIWHLEGYWIYDEVGHYQMCPTCNTISFDRAHYGTCINPTHCGDCGIEGEFDKIEHMWDGIEHDAQWHWFTCGDCGEFVKEGHDWGEPVIANGSKTYTCVDCGEVRVITTAHTHTLGTFVPTGSGAHAQTCTECGNTIATRCTLVDTTIGNLDASACIYCGYITWKLDDAANGKQEAKAVENATFELVDENGAAVESNNLSLVVYESEPEATIQLDTGASVIVKKALTITVLEDSTPVKLASTVKLSIPVVEEEMTGLKLLVVDENGELVEIEYEVIDGVMVFETNILGIFMLVQEI